MLGIFKAKDRIIAKLMGLPFFVDDLLND